MKQMKQWLSAVLALVLVMGMLPVGASAEEVAETTPETAPAQIQETIPEETKAAEETLPEEIVISGEAEPVLAGSGSCGNSLTWNLSDGVLTISGSGAMYNYDMVNYGTKQRAPWYADREKITCIILSDGVTSIGTYAFDSCRKLKTVFIPDSVTKISCDSKTSPFRNCNEDALIFCGSKSAPSGWSDSWNNADSSDQLRVYWGTQESHVRFWAGLNPSQSSVKIPDGITVIPANAFAEFSTLKTVKIPDSVTRIDENAFENCDALRWVYIPDSVTVISAEGKYDGPFNLCSEELLVCCEADEAPDGWGSYWKTLSSFDYSYATVSYGCTETDFDFWSSVSRSQSALDIPNGVTKIFYNVMNGATALRSVKIPGSVACIEHNAFAGCTGLTEVHIPATVTRIIGSPFMNCSANLQLFCEAAAAPEGWSDKWNNYTSSRKLKTYFGAGEGEASFWATLDHNATTIVVPDGITQIPEKAFANFPNLTSVTLPESMEKIGYMAFSGCSKLKEINLPDSITQIRSSAFENTALTEVELPDSLEVIEYATFSGCTNLASVTIPDGVTTIGISAFEDCTALKVLYIPESVTTIETGGTLIHGPFFGCDSKLKIFCGAEEEPEGWGFNWADHSTGAIGLTVRFGYTREDYAFWGSLEPSMTEVVVPEGISLVPNWAFDGFENLTSVTLPSTVTRIGEFAFVNCSKLVSVNLPEGLTSIGERSFMGCSKLEGIDLPSTLETMGDYAFEFCNALTHVETPESMTIVPKAAFHGCDNLSSVKLSSKLERIEPEAFCDCKLISDVFIPDTLTFLGYSAFENTNITYFRYGGTKRQWLELSFAPAICADGTIHDAGSAGLGVKWMFDDTDTLTVLGQGAMTDYVQESNVLWRGYRDYIKNIVVEEGVIALGDRVFYGCINAETATIADTVTSIHDYAFSKCYNLKSVTIPASVTSIGLEAFYDGYRLTQIHFLHGETDPLVINSGAFICFSPVATSVTVPNAARPNAAVTGYDWAGSYRYAGLTSNNCLGNHKEEVVDAVPATCTQPGNTGSVTCLVCQQVLASQEVIPALGHSFENGLCTRCGQEEPQEPDVPQEGCGYELGDVNHDGKINAKDATLILQKSVGVLKETAKFCEDCAEVSGDGKLNAKDSTLILQFSVGLRTDFPAKK